MLKEYLNIEIEYSDGRKKEIKPYLEGETYEEEILTSSDEVLSWFDELVATSNGEFEGALFCEIEYYAVLADGTRTTALYATKIF